MPKFTKKLTAEERAKQRAADAEKQSLSLLYKIIAFWFWYRFMQARDEKAGVLNQRNQKKIEEKIHRAFYGEQEKIDLQQLNRDLTSLMQTLQINKPERRASIFSMLLKIENKFFEQFEEHMDMLLKHEDPRIPGLLTVFTYIFENYKKKPDDPAFAIIGKDYHAKKCLPNNHYRDWWLQLPQEHQQTLEIFAVRIQTSAAQGQGAPVDVFSPENAYARPESPVPNWPGAMTKEVVIFSTDEEPVPDKDFQGMLAPVPNWPGAMPKEVVIFNTVNDPVPHEDLQENLELWSQLLPPAQTAA